MKSHALTGKCHCGNIHYTLDWPDKARVMPVRRCSCTFCKRIDGAWTSHPDAVLSILIEDPERVTRYRFGTKTADFLFCRNCGITLFALCEMNGNDYAVVNTHTLDPSEMKTEGGSLEFDYQQTRFDGESVEQRLKRRAERWIGQVQINYQ